MFNPVSPQFVRLIHKEKEIMLESQIELMRNPTEQAAVQRPAAAFAITTLEKRAWYTRVFPRLFKRVSLGTPASIQQKRFEEPCPGEIPC